MARAATTSDVFNAIAEPKRREIIELLARRRGMTVGAIVVVVGLRQPAVSKHLGVLREVGLVSMTKQGKNRLYQLNREQLRPVEEWVKTLERLWDRQLDRIRERAERRAAASKNSASDSLAKGTP
jgi:DNA-binding transcriptional ArsR family regulator